MNWAVIGAAELFTCMMTCFVLGRLSIEFRGTGSDWTMVVLLIVILIGTLIGLIAKELVRTKSSQAQRGGAKPDAKD
jgi:hypothetical protein